MAYFRVNQKWSIIRPRVTTETMDAPKTTSDIHHDCFALCLQHARIRNRVSIHELSQRAGVTPSAISAFERGDDEPDAQTAKTLMQALSSEHAAPPRAADDAADDDDGDGPRLH